MVYTARTFDHQEALEKGFVSKVYDTKEKCIEEALQLASFIASKSPVAVTASKQSLNFSRDHSVQEGLDHIATINAVMLQTDDLAKSATAIMTKTKPVFPKL